jgi:hypothetical protein
VWAAEGVLRGRLGRQRRSCAQIYARAGTCTCMSTHADTHTHMRSANTDASTHTHKDRHTHLLRAGGKKGMRSEETQGCAVGTAPTRTTSPGLLSGWSAANVLTATARLGVRPEDAWIGQVIDALITNAKGGGRHQQQEQQQHPRHDRASASRLLADVNATMLACVLLCYRPPPHVMHQLVSVCVCLCMCVHACKSSYVCVCVCVMWRVTTRSF